MTTIFPSGRINRKFSGATGANNTATATTITVPSDQYGVVYKLWISLDVESEADLDNLPAKLALTIAMGTLAWLVDIHPLILDTGATEIRQLDLGPWEYDFHSDGLYSGVLGDNIIVTVGAAGANVKSNISMIYSGD